jgi:hypothetical protein
MLHQQHRLKNEMLHRKERRRRLQHRFKNEMLHRQQSLKNGMLHR